MCPLPQPLTPPRGPVTRASPPHRCPAVQGPLARTHLRLWNSRPPAWPPRGQLCLPATPLPAILHVRAGEPTLLTEPDGPPCEESPGGGKLPRGGLLVRLRPSPQPGAETGAQGTGPTRAAQRDRTCSRDGHQWGTGATRGQERLGDRDGQGASWGRRNPAGGGRSRWGRFRAETPPGDPRKAANTQRLSACD